MNIEKGFAEVHQLIAAARERVFQAVNSELIKLYWDIGHYIDDKAQNESWGQGIVEALAEYIVSKEPAIKGFSARNLWRMKQFYEIYHGSPQLAKLVTELSWTNNLVILTRAKDAPEREFYIQLAIREKMSKRELERAISTGTFERWVIADSKPVPHSSSQRRNLGDHFKDTYVLDFLDLPKSYNERSLQKEIIAHLREFINELGGDFTFVAEEYRIQVGNTDFFIDLLFYHRGLQCLVAIDLKVDKFRPEFVSKMSFYLVALDRTVKKKHENPSVGIILCKDKDQEVVEFALSRDMSPTLVSEYHTELIEKSQLQDKVHKFFQRTRSK